MPTHSNRKRWKALISEFQYRKYVQPRGVRVDRIPRGHPEMDVQVMTFLAALAEARHL